jgi:hypothetical protein
MGNQQTASPATSPEILHTAGTVSAAVREVKRIRIGGLAVRRGVSGQTSPFLAAQDTKAMQGRAGAGEAIIDGFIWCGT